MAYSLQFVALKAPDGVVGLGWDALLVHKAAVRTARVVQEGCPIRRPELQHGMQPADAGVLHGKLQSMRILHQGCVVSSTLQGSRVANTKVSK